MVLHHIRRDIVFPDTRGLDLLQEQELTHIPLGVECEAMLYIKPFPVQFTKQLLSVFDPTVEGEQFPLAWSLTRKMFMNESTT